MNRLRLILHRIFRRPAITGQHRIYTRRIPTGVLLDLEDYLVDGVILKIADDPELLDLLLRIAEDRGQAREHDGWEPEALLVEELVRALGYEVPVYGRAVMRLAYRLRRCTPLPPARPARAVAIPAQREAGAA